MKNIRDDTMDNLPKTPLLTADTIIMDSDDRIILIKRKNNPYKDHWALPGGFVECGETLEQAATREAKEETGLQVEIITMVGVYSNPQRDPRGHVVTVAFLARPTFGILKPSSDAKDASKFTQEEIKGLKLSFDHENILNDAISIKYKIKFNKTKSEII